MLITIAVSGKYWAPNWGEIEMEFNLKIREK